jgi:transcriptional regulator with PAS, ATPase and Fis domain
MSAYLRYYLDHKAEIHDKKNLPSLEKLESDYMDYVLEITNNNLDKAARILNVSPSSLFSRMKKIEVWL